MKKLLAVLSLLVATAAGAQYGNYVRVLPSITAGAACPYSSQVVFTSAAGDGVGRLCICNTVWACSSPTAGAPAGEPFLISEASGTLTGATIINSLSSLNSLIGVTLVEGSGVQHETVSSANFSGDTTHAPSQGALWTYFVISDPDGDGKVSYVDLVGPGIVNVDANGQLSLNTANYLTSEVDGDATNEIQDVFQNIAVAGQTTITADNATDTLTIVAGDNITLQTSGNNLIVSASGSVSTAFSAVTSGTNTSQTLTVGNGSTLAATGTGAITATAAPWGGLTGIPSGIADGDQDEQDATEVPYTPADGGDWNDPDPTTVQGALDTIAAGGLGGSVTEVVNEAVSAANFAGDIDEAASQDDLWTWILTWDTDGDGLPDKLDTAPTVGFVTVDPNGTIGVDATTYLTENCGSTGVACSIEGTDQVNPGVVGPTTASRCARFDSSGYLIAASGDCANGDTTGGTPAFSTITTGTNSQAAMVVTTGASLSASGSGTIAATSVPWSGVSNPPAGLADGDDDTTYTADGNGIELSTTTFSLELDGSTLSKSANGLKVNTVAAASVTVVDSGAYWTATDVEGVLAEIGAAGVAAPGSDGDVPYNNGAGALTAEAAFNYDDVTNTLTLGTLAVDAVDGTDPGAGNNSHITLFNNDTACPDPATGSATLCVVGTDWYSKAPGVTSYKVLSANGGDYGDLTCTTGSCTLDNATVDGSNIAINNPVTDAQGDIMYYSGSAWVTLAPGTSGYVLSTQGAGANPQWIAGGSASTWIGLSDTDPTAYTNEAGKIVQVNATEDGLEFGAVPIPATITSAAQHDVLVYDGSTPPELTNRSLPDCDTAGTSKLLYSRDTGTFSCGTDQGGTETNTLTTVTTGIADDQVPVGSSANVAQYKTLPDCDNATASKLLYDQATNTFTCGTDQDTAGGNTFGTIAVSGQSDVVANGSSASVELIGGTGITLTTNATNDTVTITATGTTTVANDSHDHLDLRHGKSWPLGWLTPTWTTGTIANPAELIRSSTALAEPSGAVWHPRIRAWIVVSDSRAYRIFDETGADIANGTFANATCTDPEGVTIADPMSDSVYVQAENLSGTTPNVIGYMCTYSLSSMLASTSALTATGYWTIDSDNLQGTDTTCADTNSAWEGVTFVPDGTLEDAAGLGGYFLLSCQSPGGTDSHVHGFTAPAGTTGQLMTEIAASPFVDSGDGKRDLCGLEYDRENGVLYGSHGSVYDAGVVEAWSFPDMTQLARLSQESGYTDTEAMAVGPGMLLLGDDTTSTLGIFEWPNSGHSTARFADARAVVSDSCTNAIADGTLCWDRDNDALSAGTGTAVVSMVQRTSTATLDFGGATLEVPNGSGGSSPVVSGHTGDIAIDTDLDQLIYHGTTYTRVLDYLQTVDLVISDPVAADSQVVKRFPRAVNISKVTCVATGTTPSISVNFIDCGTDPTCASPDGDVLSGDITCDGGEDSSTNFANAAIVVGGYIKLDLGTPTGTVDSLLVTAEYTIDRQ